MRILIVAIEAERWGPARLPQALRAAGVAVAALCPRNNPLAASGYLDRCYVLSETRSSGRMAAQLAAAIASWSPQLIVPADEQVVALLHALVRHGPSAEGLDAAALAIITDSLGPPDKFDAMLMKSHTQALARRLGVRVPKGGTIVSANQAIALASDIGYPVYLKTSFSWAGSGAVLCQDSDALVAAMAPATSRLAWAKTWLRRRLHRDWYPTGTPTDVQQAIAGTPAMYCAVAWRGQVLAGFAGIKRKTRTPNGPSTTVCLGPHPEMAQAVEKMVGGLDATGFIAFDFMIEEATGQLFLLECNPRPNQVCHLGACVGVDLALALADVLEKAGASENSGTLIATHEATVTLFPQHWQGNLPGAAPPGVEVDVPWDDPGLLRFISSNCPAAGAALGLMVRPELNARFDG